MNDIAWSEARYLALLHRALIKRLDRELVPLGLGSGRYLYLFGLYIEDGRKQQDFADRLGLDKAAVTRSLARLEREGYVHRRPDPIDGRVTRVYLTARGQAVKPSLEAAAACSLASLNEPLDEEERETLRRLLKKMALPLLSG